MKICSWEQHAVCPCGWHTYAPFGNVFHVPFEVCPECGNGKGTGPFYNWNVVSMRWTSSSKWYNPRTWKSGEWETHK